MQMLTVQTKSNAATGIEGQMTGIIHKLPHARSNGHIILAKFGAD